MIIHNGIIRCAGMHTFQLSYVVFKQLLCSLWPNLVFSLLFHFHYFAVITFASQLFFNAFYLLLQKIFTLLLVYFRAGFSSYLILKFGKLKFALQQFN